MAALDKLANEIKQARFELKNIRQQLETVKRVHKKEIDGVIRHLNQCLETSKVAPNHCDIQDESMQKLPEKLKESCNLQPIGHIKSVFKYKNGTPRQANVCQNSRAMLQLRADLFTNPEHSLQGLQQFSHLWLIYQFHKNSNSYSKAKVAPPRLNGERVGVFSTRSPYRPNPVGLSLVQIQDIKGCCVYLSGVDVLDGTPVLDVKPYIPQYDTPVVFPSEPKQNLNEFHEKSQQEEFSAMDICVSSVNDIAMTAVKSAEWIQTPPIETLTVNFTPKAEEQLKTLSKYINSLKCPTESSNIGTSEKTTQIDTADEINNCDDHVRDIKSNAAFLNICDSVNVEASKTTESHEVGNNFQTEICNHKQKSGSICSELKRESAYNYQAARQAIVSILAADPRSSYRRKHCQDRLYYFTYGNLHITCWFYGSVAEVLNVKFVMDETPR